MSDVLINFVGDASTLKPVEDIYETLIKKDKELEDQTKKSAALIAQKNKEFSSLEKQLYDERAASVKQLQDLNKKLEERNKAIEEGSKKAVSQTEKLVSSTKNLDKSVVGGQYKKFLLEIQTGLQYTNKELIKYLENVRKNAQKDILSAQNNEEIAELNLLLEITNEQLDAFKKKQEEIDDSTNTVAQRIKDLKTKLIELSAAGKDGTVEYKAMQDELLRLSKVAKDTSTEIKNIGSDTKNIDGLISIAGGVAGGFAVAQGTMALFGDESEDMQKALVKLNAAMAILQGLQEIQNILQKESAASILLTSIFYKQKAIVVAENVAVTEASVAADIQQVASSTAVAAAETTQAAATVAATEAQVALNTAMSLNPVAVIIAGIVALAAAVYIFSSNNKDAADEQFRLNKALQEAGPLLEGDLKLLEQRTSKQLALAKERGKTVVDLARIEGDAGNERLKQIDDARVAAAVAYNAAKANDKESLETKQKLYERITELEIQYQDERKALEVKASEFRKTKADEELKSFIAFQQAKVAATISGTVNERNVQIETIKAIAAEREKSADFIALTEGEKALQRANDDRTIRGLQLANYQNYLKGRTALYESFIANAKISLLKNEKDSIDSINAITNFEIAALKKRRDEAIKGDPTLNTNEARKIVTETNLAIAQLEKEKQAKLLQIQKSAINAQLIASKKGTEEEYNLKVQLINKEQQIELAAVELTQEKINEINAQFNQQRLEALNLYTEAQLQNAISFDNAALERFGIMENEKLALTLKRLKDQQALEILQADENAAKIAEINAKYDKQAIDAKKAYFEQIYQLRKREADLNNAQIISELNTTRNSGASTIAEKKAAVKELQEIEEKGFRERSNLIYAEYLNHVTTDQEYADQAQELDNDRVESRKKTNKELNELDAAALQEAFSRGKAIYDVFLNGIKSTLGDTALTAALTEIENLGAKAIDVFAKIKEGELSTSEGIKEIAVAATQSAQSVINQIYADSAAKRAEILNEEIELLNEQKEKELSAKNLTEQQKADIDAKYREKERALKREAFLNDKEAKKQQAIINGLLAVTLAFATTPFPASLITAGIVAAATIAEVVAINNTKVPKFKTGKVDIQGPGTTTSDSIPARISKGESVIKADSTAKWKDALHAINNDQFEDYLAKKMQSFIFPQVPEHLVATSSGIAIDYEKLADAIGKRIPAPVQVTNTIDGDGLHQFVIEGGNKTEYKNSRYSMT